MDGTEMEAPAFRRPGDRVAAGKPAKKPGSELWRDGPPKPNWKIGDRLKLKPPKSKPTPQAAPPVPQAESPAAPQATSPAVPPAAAAPAPLKLDVTPASVDIMELSPRAMALRSPGRSSSHAYAAVKAAASPSGNSRLHAWHAAAAAATGSSAVPPEAPDSPVHSSSSSVSDNTLRELLSGRVRINELRSWRKKAFAQLQHLQGREYQDLRNRLSLPCSPTKMTPTMVAAYADVDSCKPRSPAASSAAAAADDEAPLAPAPSPCSAPAAHAVPWAPLGPLPSGGSMSGAGGRLNSPARSTGSNSSSSSRGLMAGSAAAEGETAAAETATAATATAAKAAITAAGEASADISEDLGVATTMELPASFQDTSTAAPEATGGLLPEDLALLASLDAELCGTNSCTETLYGSCSDWEQEQEYEQEYEEEQEYEQECERGQEQDSTPRPSVAPSAADIVGPLPLHMWETAIEYTGTYIRLPPQLQGLASVLAAAEAAAGSNAWPEADYDVGMSRDSMWRRAAIVAWIGASLPAGFNPDDPGCVETACQLRDVMSRLQLPLVDGFFYNVYTGRPALEVIEDMWRIVPRVVRGINNQGPSGEQPDVEDGVVHEQEAMWDDGVMGEEDLQEPYGEEQEPYGEEQEVYGEEQEEQAAWEAQDDLQAGEQHEADAAGSEPPQVVSPRGSCSTPSARPSSRGCRSSDAHSRPCSPTGVAPRAPAADTHNCPRKSSRSSGAFGNAAWFMGGALFMLLLVQLQVLPMGPAVTTTWLQPQSGPVFFNGLKSGTFMSNSSQGLVGASSANSSTPWAAFATAATGQFEGLSTASRHSMAFAAARLQHLSTAMQRHWAAALQRFGHLSTSSAAAPNPVVAAAADSMRQQLQMWEQATQAAVAAGLSKHVQQQVATMQAVVAAVQSATSSCKQALLQAAPARLQKPAAPSHTSPQAAVSQAAQSIGHNSSCPIPSSLHQAAPTLQRAYAQTRILLPLLPLCPTAQTALYETCHKPCGDGWVELVQQVAAAAPGPRCSYDSSSSFKRMLQQVAAAEAAAAQVCAFDKRAGFERMLQELAKTGTAATYAPECKASPACCMAGRVAQAFCYVQRADHLASTVLGPQGVVFTTLAAYTAPIEAAVGATLSGVVDLLIGV